MKAVGRFASFVLVALTSIVITITACGGGGSQPGGGGGGQRHLDIPKGASQPQRRADFDSPESWDNSAI